MVINRRLSPAAKLISFWLVSILLVGCTCSQRIRMNAELPPTFYLKGNAVFDWIEVFDLESPRSKSGDPRAIWRIEPDGPPPRLHSVPPITYGKVPSGFVQTDPYSEPPPALQEGHRYQLRVIIRSPDGNQLDEVFIIRNGKAERIEGGDEEHKNPCFAD